MNYAGTPTAALSEVQQTQAGQIEALVTDSMSHSAQMVMWYEEAHKLCPEFVGNGAWLMERGSG